MKPVDITLALFQHCPVAEFRTQNQGRNGLLLHTDVEHIAGTPEGYDTVFLVHLIDDETK